MKVKRLELHNFRAASKVEFDFSEQLNLFVGINGAGKSTVLDALAISLSWLVNRIQREGVSGRPIPESSIKNDQADSAISLFVNNNDQDYGWLIAKTALGKSSKAKSQLRGVSELADKFKTRYENTSSLPIVVYYPVGRGVDSTKPYIPVKNSTVSLDVYENALSGKTNYDALFEWLRIQDDIVNEQAQSQTRWIIQNKSWIKKRVNNLLNLLSKIIPKNNSLNTYREFDYFINRFDDDDLIFEEPRFLFRELSYLFHMIEMDSSSKQKYETILQDLEYIFHRMSSRSSEFISDRILEDAFYVKAIENFIKNFCELRYGMNANKETLAFFLECFNFAILLSLWWLSNNSKLALEQMSNKFKADKYTDQKNWRYLTVTLLESWETIIKNDIQRKGSNQNEGRELQFVKIAIESFLPKYKHLQVKRSPYPHITIDKNGESFDLNQLSDGEKNLIALVGDIARRLTTANPRIENPLSGEGIVLIDEVDLHLHPSWQRLVIPKLLEVFPNCQFFLSTHSPQVISHVKPENIFLLKQSRSNMSHSPVIESYGKNSDRILEDILDVDARPSKEKAAIHKIYDLIREGKLDLAKRKIQTLKTEIKEDSELVNAEVLIKRKEIIGK